MKCSNNVITPLLMKIQYSFINDNNIFDYHEGDLSKRLILLLAVQNKLRNLEFVYKMSQIRLSG